jgi:M6 family metalloprotease-like protein
MKFEDSETKPYSASSGERRMNHSLFAGAFTVALFVTTLGQGWLGAAPPQEKASAKALELRRFNTGEQGPIRLAVSLDGRFALSGGTDGTLRWWDLATGKERNKLTGHNGRIVTVAFHPDQRHALSGGEDNQLLLWDLVTGKNIRSFTGHNACVCGAVFSPDGKHIASGSLDRTVRLWDVGSGKELNKFDGHTGGILAVDFSPNGKLLASASEDKSVRLWDLTAGKETKSLVGHTAPVRAVCFSADGQHLLSGGGKEDGTARLWDVVSGKELHCLKAIPEGVLGVSLSPEGCRSLVAGGNKVQVWDLEHGKLLHTFDGLHSAADAKFLPDGGHALLAEGEGKTLRLCRPPDDGSQARPFGYENRKLIGERPLLFLWMRDSGKAKSRHDFEFFERLFFGAKNPRALSINGYLREVSHGKFSFKLAGKIGPHEYGTFDNLDYRKICSDAIRLAKEKYKFDFAPFDRNKDGVLTTDELAVILIYNRWNLDAWCRWAFRNSFDDPKLLVDLAGVVGYGEEVGFASINHELMHSFGINFEMYDHGFHDHLTVMGATIFNNPDDRQTFHPDAWIKMQFGWVEPKVSSLQLPGRATLLAQQVKPYGDKHGSVILYHPSKGTNEFFLLEYRNPKARGGSYDANVSSAGVAIWHVIHGNNKWITSVPVEGKPKATVASLFNRGAPDWRQGGNKLYTNQDRAIVLKWLDSSDAGVRLRFEAPTEGGTCVAIRWGKK